MDDTEDVIDLDVIREKINKVRRVARCKCCKRREKRPRGFPSFN